MTQAPTLSLDAPTSTEAPQPPPTGTKAEPPPVLLDGISRRYGRHQAVHPISLQAAAGRIHGFLGPNGAGKTTLLRMLVGIIRPTTGTARILGMDVKGDTREIKRRIGYLPQGEAVHGALTVEENLRFSLGMRSVPRRLRTQMTEEALTTAGLTHLSRRRASELSGGQRRLLSIAMSIAARPPLVILDEPTANLDPQARETVWDLLTGLRDAGLTLILTTHAMDEAERCDGIWLMDEGRLLCQGSPDELRQRYPHHVYEIVFDHPVSISVLRDIPHERILLFGARARIATSLPRSWDLAAAIQPLATIISINRANPTLEEVYLDLVEDRNRT